MPPINFGLTEHRKLLGLERYKNAPYVPSYASASFPTPSSDGEVILSTDGIRGLRVSRDGDWIHQYGDTINPREWGILGDESDETSKWAAMISAAPAGSKIEVPPPASYYKLTDTLAVSKALSFLGHNFPEIRQTTSNKGAFNISSSDVGIFGLKLKGPQYASSQVNEIAIRIAGADSSNYIDSFHVEKCKFQNWGAYMVFAQFASRLWILRNEMADGYQAGVCFLSCSNAWIEMNRIDNISGAAEPYGVQCSREEDDSLVTHPLCSNIMIYRNRIIDIPWNGLDTHGGSGIKFLSNIISGCYRSIAIGSCDGSSNNPTFAPYNCDAINNDIDSGVSDGSAVEGIIITGAYDSGVVAYADNCKSIGNTINSCGGKSALAQAGLVAYVTRGFKSQGDILKSCSPTGIHLYHNNVAPQINGAQIFDPWTDDGDIGVAYGIRIGGPNCSDVLIGDVLAIDTGSGKTYRLDTASGIAIRINNETGNTGSIGVRRTNATTEISDASSPGFTALTMS